MPGESFARHPQRMAASLLRGQRRGGLHRLARGRRGNGGGGSRRRGCDPAARRRHHDRRRHNRLAARGLPPDEPAAAVVGGHGLARGSTRRSAATRGVHRCRTACRCRTAHRGTASPPVAARLGVPGRCERSHAGHGSHQPHDHFASHRSNPRGSPGLETGWRPARAAIPGAVNRRSRRLPGATSRRSR